eukprot:CAMPEP_0185188884 /NCGR_PEP_ID=MMETSP1140-20130426/5688_1 /TAXON_ID=298111 /ORGANISM="Pavlova sp., Strain CCMP459" /LENGTH=112 /DNA_ID=CAMNT_0027755401 /DNA_START=369 /DNA_END=708 /DNA_ORIENTATION=+
MTRMGARFRQLQVRTLARCRDASQRQHPRPLRKSSVRATLGGGKVWRCDEAKVIRGMATSGARDCGDRVHEDGIFTSEHIEDVQRVVDVSARRAVGYVCVTSGEQHEVCERS